MSPEKQREIASKGGKSLSIEVRREIGRKGGMARAEKLRRNLIENTSRNDQQPKLQEQQKRPLAEEGPTAPAQVSDGVSPLDRTVQMTGAQEKYGVIPTIPESRQPGFTVDRKMLQHQEQTAQS